MSLFAQSDISHAAQSMIRDFGRGAAEKAAHEAVKAGAQERVMAETVWRQIEQEINRVLSETERG